MLKEINWLTSTAVALLAFAVVMAALGVAHEDAWQLGGALVCALVGVGVAVLVVAQKIDER